MVGLATAAALFGPVDLPGALACGTKIARGTCRIRYQRLHTSHHPSSILLYRRPGSEAASEALGSEFQKVLGEIGHKVTVAEDSEDLARVLRSGKVDIVLTGLEDAGLVEQQIAGTSAGALVVPVVPAEGEGTEAGAGRRFRHVLLAGSSMTERLERVEEAAGAAGE